MSAIPDLDDYLVNGQLFVTVQQYRALLKEAHVIEPRVDNPLTPLVGDIPVHMVTPGKPVPVGDGTMAAVFDGKVYIYPEDLTISDPESPPDVPPPPIDFGQPGSRGGFRR